MGVADSTRTKRPGGRHRSDVSDGWSLHSGHKPAMSSVPPLIHYAALQGPAYLLRWEENEPRVWEAEIAWVERAGLDWKARRARVPSGELTEIAGQDYRLVPRYRLRDRFRRTAQAVPQRSH